MTHDLHNKTQQLIQDIEKKDRRFRLAQSVFTILILLVLVGVITAQYRTLAGVQNQLDSQKNIAATSDKRDREQQATILRRLDCMTVFFSQKDRTNLTIENIDQCTLNRDGDIQKFFTQDSSGQTQTTKTEQPSDPKAPSTPLQGESATPTQPTVPVVPTPETPKPNLIQRIINGLTTIF